MRILAVDDDPIILDILGQVLAYFDLNDLTVAANGHEALSILKSDPAPFDLLLFDIQMPEMDGITLTKMTRRLPGYADTPILMLTAMSDKSYIDRAFAAGATDYITKPFETNELHARLTAARLLSEEQRRLRQELSHAMDADASSPGRGIRLEEAYVPRDVDGVVPLPVFKNYVRQLGRGALLTSSLIGFKIKTIQRIYDTASDFDYACALTDVADGLVSALDYPHYLLAHCGSGKFVCIADGVTSDSIAVLEDEIALALDAIEPCYGDGRPMTLPVQVGEPIPLRFRMGLSIDRAVDDALAKVDGAKTLQHAAPVGVLAGLFLGSESA